MRIRKVCCWLLIAALIMGAFSVNVFAGTSEYDIIPDERIEQGDEFADDELQEEKTEEESTEEKLYANIVYSGTCGINLIWELDSDGQLTISGEGDMDNYDYYSSYAPWYTYAASINQIVIDKDVTGIGNYAFYQCRISAEIRIPDSVTTIGRGAFNYCNALTSLIVPDGVTSISDYMCHGCTNLTSIRIPDNVTYIGDGAFLYCKNLQSIDIPDCVTYIGNSAFQGCENLDGITIPDGVTFINDYMLDGCKKLTSVEIPNGVTAIGEYAFYDCRNITDITIPEHVTSLGRYAFYNCDRLDNITIFGSITNIGEHTFDNCSKLKSMTLPNSLKNIMKYASRLCICLTNIYYDGTAEERAAITIDNSGNGNDNILKAVWHYHIHPLEKHSAVSETCTENGNSEYYSCSICEEYFSDELALTRIEKDSWIIEASGHKGNEPVIENRIDSTCENTGSYDEVVYCSVCTEEIERCNRIIPKKDHTTEVIRGKEATCTDTGLTDGIKCSKCNATLKVQTMIPAMGHEWNGVITTQPTCTEAGVMTYTCKHDASHKYTEEIAKLAHNAGEAVRENEIAATCTEVGRYDEVTYCKDCGEELSRNTVPVDSLGHDLKHIEAEVATCTKAGNIDYWRCKRCKKLYSDEAGENVITLGDTVIAQKDHTAGKTVIENEVAATCMEAGRFDKVTYCASCGKELTRVAVNIDAIGHKWGDWKVTKEATETTVGEETRICKNDPSHAETREIAKKLHVHALIRVPAKATTLNATGNIEHYKCSECGKLFLDAECKTETTLEEVTIPKLISIENATVTGIKNKTYTGKNLTQNLKVVVNGKTLINGTDYKLTYKNRKNAGTATMTITGTGDYTGTITKTFEILQAKNSITKVTTSKNISLKQLEKKNQSFTIGAIAKEKAKLSFNLKSVPSKAKKYISVSSSGRVTVKKGLPKGTYVLKVQITAAKTKNYKKTSVTKTVKVIVK